MPTSGASRFAAHIAGATSCDLHMEVTGSNGTDKYEVVRMDGKWSCTCPAFKFGHGAPCKHIDRIVGNLEKYFCLICKAPWCNGDHSVNREGGK